MSDYLQSRRDHINNGRPLKQKKNYTIPKKSVKRIEKEKQEKERLGGDDTDLVKFYKACMKRMTGHCLNCHNRTETKIYSAAIFSICHILDKRDTMCPSVKTHPRNWVELCVDCHNNFDTPPFEKDKTLWDKREEMGVWPIVKERLIHLYDHLDKSELRHFPQSVKSFIENNQPF